MGKAALDPADIRILSAIQQHGMLSKSKLAELVHVSSTVCWRRLNNLKKSGLIKGYHADIALDRIIDISKVIVTISLSSHRQADFDKFENYIRRRDEIINCIATGGGTDYVLTVVVSRLNLFQLLMDEMLAAELHIERYMTYIATREVKSGVPNLHKLTIS